MNKHILALVMTLTILQVSAQPFIKNLKVLADSVPMNIVSYVDFGALEPLDRQCICLKTPTLKYEGKVLVEFLGSTTVNLGTFYGYSKNGLINSCFIMRELKVFEGKISYLNKEMNYVVVREPNDKLFR